ncbi:MAG: pentapeptide repeat-containing protein [Phycisphaerae bacterium]
MSRISLRRGAKLNEANLSRAQLEGASLSRAQLNRAKGLTQPQLDGACGNEETQLPKGLTVARCF